MTAVEQAVNQAVPDLGSLFEPVSASEFLLNYFGAAPLHCAGSADRFPAVTTDCDPFVQGLARCLEMTLEAPVVSSLSQECEGETDVFVLQLEGEQHSILSIDDDHTEQYSLTPGSALYIPRAWSRRTPHRSSDSCCLTFAVMNPTGAELLAWITDKIQAHEAFQRDIPRFAGPAEQQAYQSAMRRVIMRAFRMPDLILRYSRRLNHRAPIRPGSKPESQILFSHLRRPSVHRRDEQTIYIAVETRQVAFPLDAAPLLHYLIDSAPVTIDSFYAYFENEFDRDELTSFLSALSDAGVISLA
jgi:Cupin superfamily protein